MTNTLRFRVLERKCFLVNKIKLLQIRSLRGVPGQNVADFLDYQRVNSDFNSHRLSNAF